MSNTLPAHWYHDAEIFAQERRQIFAEAWWLLGPVAGLENHGDYLADSICGWPVIVVRTASELAGYHNVCRHRASALLSAGRGCVEAFRCPYHGWLYNLNGQLTNAPRFNDENTLPPGLNLFPIQVDTWRGLVFVRIASAGPTLKQWLGSADPLLEGYPSTESLAYFDNFTISGDANWKTYCDNTVEGYHLNLVHPRLGESLRRGDVNIVSYDEGHTVAFHVRYAPDSDGTSLRGADGLWLYKFPGFQLVAGATVFKAERVEATGPSTLRSSNWSWFGDLSGDEKSDAFAWGKHIVEEDLGICQGVQKNLMAGIYEHGPLSPKQEAHTARLQAIIREKLTVAA